MKETPTPDGAKPADDEADESSEMTSILLKTGLIIQ